MCIATFFLSNILHCAIIVDLCNPLQHGSPFLTNAIKNLGIHLAEEEPTDFLNKLIIILLRVCNVSAKHWAGFVTASTVNACAVFVAC